MLECLVLRALGAAMAQIDHPDADATTLAAEDLAHRIGLPPAVGSPVLPGVNGVLRRHRPITDTSNRRGLSVQCFGTFSIGLDGFEVDLSTLRPRARSALRLLALQGGRAVHREVLTEALWPGGDPESARRNLHVAVSSIRRLLGGAPGPMGSPLRRDGDAYRLDVEESSSDLHAFEAAAGEAEAATARGDHDVARAAIELALSLHRGELLAEEGPAEWVVGTRRACVGRAVTLAVTLAEIELRSGRPAAAASACERGLRLDRFHDALWRRLIEAHEVSGDRAAAVRARRDYDGVMRDLGVLC